MKHIFIVNPVAGIGNAKDFFSSQILSYMKNDNIDYKIYVTTGIGDAKKAVEYFCNKRRYETDMIRFYSCGGDGTLNEVINGVFGKSNVSVACMPAGSGNDFIRNFGEENLFKDIKAQLNGKVKKVDVISCKLDNGEKKYGINLVNIGADCVAMKYKQSVKLPLLKGASAYMYGALRAFIELVSLPVTIILDNKEKFKERVTLLAVGNGTTYGAGFKPTPEAKVDDGILDVCIVRKINRRQFLKLIGAYKKGEHINIPIGKDVIGYKTVQNIDIKSKEEIDITIDGEMLRAKEISMKVIPNAISFVVPQNE